MPSSANGSLQIGRRDHGLQILDPALEREVADVPVGHTAPALVVTHEAEVIAEEANPVSPDRALPFVFEVGQPVRGLDQHGSRARLGPGELDSVSGTHDTGFAEWASSSSDVTSFARIGSNVPAECPAVYPNRDETPIAWQRRKPHPMRREMRRTRQSPGVSVRLSRSNDADNEKSVEMEAMPCSNESFSLPTEVSAT